MSKTRATGRQPIQVGRLHNGMAVTASGIALVFVGHDKEQVHGLHDRSFGWHDDKSS
jgi:hypothetical protein